mmetsp:Transcript_8776/g.21276  ORF Transcript_8776/g.21276 Transcript_8776/m.21276 type:complete len:266 (+) Transcript_8776:350-1147(+)
MPIRLAVLPPHLKLEAFHQSKEAGQPPQIRQSDMHARPHRRAHVGWTASEVPQTGIVREMPSALAQLPLQVTYAVHERGEDSLDVAPLTKAHDSKMILLVDPYHEVGCGGIEIADVGVDGAAIGPVPTESGGDRPFVRIVEENVPLDEIEVLIVRHAQHGQIGPIREVGQLKVPRALAHESLDPSSVGATHRGGELHPVEGPRHAYSGGDYVLPLRISLTVRHETGIVDDSGMPAEGCTLLALGGYGRHMTSGRRGGGRSRRCLL